MKVFALTGLAFFIVYVGSRSFNLFRDVEPKAGSVELVEISDVASAEAIWIDVRDEAFYNAGHICGSLSVPYTFGALDERLLDVALSSEVPIILYGDDRSCNWARETARLLAARLEKNVYYYILERNKWSVKGGECYPLLP